ncbi:MAG: hypothetical protein CL678_08220 [Bdellovibrionaceae bacterium]|nr:hypothetical protein [Pseudobdellovibrionaceae bacterium]|tara:strand:- start:31 stop:546 length:516 start_codon:yes stop_codon:yes gene_type:complete
MNKSESRALKANARPLRVAFLVDPSCATDKQINEIIVWSCNKWGGSYFPIIPCNGTQIEDDWWALLEIADPDIIHSNVSIGDDLLERINRFIVPFSIIENVVEDPENDRFLDHFELKGLSIYDIPSANISTTRRWNCTRVGYFVSSNKKSPQKQCLAVRGRVCCMMGFGYR